MKAPKDPDLLRRVMVSGLSTVAVAAMGASAPVRQARAQTKPRDENLLDPVTDYPAPPFPRQKLQEPPGLLSLMNPRPDHGETSYKGSGRLAGRRALITGGDSGIGRAAAIA